MCTERTFRKLAKYLPSNEEWELIRKICQILRPFYDMTVKVSSTTSPTLHSVVPDINLLYEYLESVATADNRQWPKQIREAARSGLEVLKDYYGRTSDKRLMYSAVCKGLFDSSLLVDFCFSLDLTYFLPPSLQSSPRPPPTFQLL